MTPDQVAKQVFENGRRRGPVAGLPSRRLLLAAVSLSLLVHLLPVGLFVLLPRATQQKTEPDLRGEVELLMVERTGAEPTRIGQSADGTARPEAANAAPAAPQPAETPPAQAMAPTVPATSETGEPVPLPPSPVPRSASPPAASQRPPPTTEALVFNFAGTDSDTNAKVMSGHILPAMPDDRFRNRPPPYPLEAAMRGEAGAVVVIIHVSAYGFATGADVAESSGSPTLDRAAVAAVRKWHFHPAMKEGQAIPFEMPFRFVFSAE